MSIGEPLDVNPAGYDNCEKLHKFIRLVNILIGTILYSTTCSEENISKTDNVVGVSVNDCRIFYDGSRIQERRFVLR